MSSYFDHFLLINIFNIVSDSFFMLMSMTIMLTLLKHKNKLMNNSKQSILNKIYSHWSELMTQNLNQSSTIFIFPFFYLFSTLVLMNFLGFLMFCFPITTHMNITFTTAFIIWIYMMMMGMYKFKFNYFSMFMPNGSPLVLSPLLVMMEMASFISSPMALGLSLAANLTAGHILMAMLSDFSSKLLMMNFNLLALFPMLVMMFMVILELGVLFIQAYVFSLLSVMYLKDSLMLH